jgi:hypothetical protein
MPLVKDWWEVHGKIQYPEASNILIIADGGGSNSSRQYIFKEDLQRLANKIGIEMRMAHYPSSTSKYNPIEQRLFCHVTRACAGTLFTSGEMVKELIDKTSTSTGLKVMTSRKEKVYKTARKASEDFRGGLKLKQDHAFETDSSQFPFSSFFLHPLRQRCRQLLQQQQRLLQLLSQPGPQAWPLLSPSFWEPAT